MNNIRQNSLRVKNENWTELPGPSQVASIWFNSGRRESIMPLQDLPKLPLRKGARIVSNWYEGVMHEAGWVGGTYFLAQLIDPLRLAMQPLSASRVVTTELPGPLQRHCMMGLPVEGLMEQPLHEFW